MSVECRYQTGNDEYATPYWLRNSLFHGWFDPCPLCDGVVKEDGLKVVWRDRTFVNPPYSNVLPFVEKAISENKQGKTVVILLKHDSSTKWFRLLHEAGAEFLLFSGRLHFNYAKGAAPFPSVLAVLAGSKKREILLRGFGGN